MKRRDALQALMSLPLATRISVVRAEPQDVIVLETDQRISEETACKIQEKLKQIWPKQKCVVLGDGLKLKVLKSDS